jgi:hypothetical protein
MAKIFNKIIAKEYSWDAWIKPTMDRDVESKTNSFW